MNNGSISIGVSSNNRIVVNISTEGVGATVTDLSPAAARIYAAMMMALANLLDPPDAEGSGASSQWSNAVQGVYGPEYEGQNSEETK